MSKDQRPRTVFITGTSGGIGLATAQFFSTKGWNVVATMRRPDAVEDLVASPTLIKLPLDVNNESEIAAAFAAAIKTFGGVDVLVNNAGYGLVGIFEETTEGAVRQQFETNVFGLMRVTRHALHHFRQKRQGLIINLSSVGGRTAIPLYSSYHASKFAVEGFTESLQFELKPLGIQVKLIEPAAVKTDFVGRSAVEVAAHLPDYQSYSRQKIAKMKDSGDAGIAPIMVARDIYKAATDGSAKLRYISGAQAKAFLFLQWLLPRRFYTRLITAAL